jgi:hypothetical protein
MSVYPRAGFAKDINLLIYTIAKNSHMQGLGDD